MQQRSVVVVPAAAVALLFVLPATAEPARRDVTPIDPTGIPFTPEGTLLAKARVGRRTVTRRNDATVYVEFGSRTAPDAGPVSWTFFNSPKSPQFTGTFTTNRRLKAKARFETAGLEAGLEGLFLGIDESGGFPVGATVTYTARSASGTFTAWIDGDSITAGRGVFRLRFDVTVTTDEGTSRIRMTMKHTGEGLAF